MAAKKSTKKAPKAQPAKGEKVLKTKRAPALTSNHNEVVLAV